ncbi:unnamed protein product [Polarella glacialis]|uniref:Reverse transcriptase domain-containing protein n=1 Tax=Polarella glacialis TaxID=89957 RepID=A0A813LIS9_POLGL|nr:unnamed protein product [Polarella glacialis]
MGDVGGLGGQGGPAALLTELEILEAQGRLDSDLMALLDGKAVPLVIQARLALKGYTSISVFALVEDNRTAFREFLRNDLLLESNADPASRFATAAMVACWEAAKTRFEKRNQADADASAARLPKTVPRIEHLELRMKFAKMFYEIKDKVTPAKTLLEGFWENIEEGELRPMSLKELVSREDTEDDNMVAGFDLKTGYLKLSKNKKETAMPVDFESLRLKLKLLGHLWIFSKLKFPNKAKDELGNTVATPSLELVLAYDFQIRKEMIRRINSGTEAGEALRLAKTDITIKERFFTTPCGLQALASGSSGSRGRSRERSRGRQTGQRQQGGQGKGGWQGGSGGSGGNWQPKGGRGAAVINVEGFMSAGGALEAIPYMRARRAITSETGPAAKPVLEFKVLYLFAGDHRKCSLKECLSALFGKKEGKALKKSFTVLLVFEEWDILRGDEFDLSKKTVQENLNAKITAGVYDYVLMSPPCNSWTRVLFANRWGPSPVRSAQHPWGFPWLKKADKLRAELGNCFVKHCLAILKICRDAVSVQTGRRVRVFWEHPEDLGALWSETVVVQPASVWQLPEMREEITEAHRRWTMAFWQCYFGSNYAKPTRVVTDIPGLRGWGPEEWPQMDARGWYQGPLPRKCGHSDHVTLAKQSPEEASYRTTGIAAYPPAMDAAIAKAIYEDILTARSEQVKDSSEGHRPVGGVKADVPQKEEKKKRKRVELKPRKELRKQDREVESGEDDLPPGLVDDSEDEGAELREPESESEVEEDDYLLPDPVDESEDEEAGEELEAGAAPCNPVTLGGVGSPIRVATKGTTRSLHDGGGLCSPGRWPPARRTLPGTHFDAIRSCFVKGLRVWECRVKEEPGGVERAFAELACGKVQESPFKKEAVQVKEDLDAILRSKGFDPGPKPGDRKTVIAYRRLRASLAAARDADWKYLDELAAKGIAIGVGVELPRTPAVYEEKKSWKLKEIEDSIQDIRRQVDLDVKAGAALRMEKKVAKEKYGDWLTVAALGAIVKEPGSEEVRILYDGTNKVGTNNRIRVMDRMRVPGIGDLDAMLRQARDDEGAPRLGMVFDIAKAHRLIPVREEDWGLQAFALDDDPDHLYLYTTGTFGIASAAYWWSRVSGGIVRLVHYILGKLFFVWMLLYADDGLVLGGGNHQKQSLLLLFLILEVFDVPVSWKKVKGGFSLDWIGYSIDVKGFQVGVNVKKVEWVQKWVEERLRDGGVLGRIMKSGVGRLCFLVGVLEHVKPFLGPLFAWNAKLAVGSFVALPPAVRLLLTWIVRKVTNLHMRPCKSLPSVWGEAFRLDAKAQGDLVCIGGWESFGGISCDKARWFSVRLSKKQIPWAFAKGEPFKTVASLELLGVLISILVFIKDAPWRNGVAQVAFTAFTDNQGNGYLLNKLMTSKYPLNVILIEVAEQLEAANAFMNLEWVPREQNVEADALTNEEFAGFDLSKRIEVNFESLPLLVLPSLMASAEELYRIAQTQELWHENRFTKKANAKQSDPW